MLPGVSFKLKSYDLDNLEEYKTTNPNAPQIYPNPFNNFIHISSIDLVDDPEAYVYIANVLGEVLYFRRLTIDETRLGLTLDVSNLATGRYQLTIETLRNISTSVLIKISED